MQFYCISNILFFTAFSVSLQGSCFLVSQRTRGQALPCKTQSAPYPWVWDNKNISTKILDRWQTKHGTVVTEKWWQAGYIPCWCVTARVWCTSFNLSLYLFFFQRPLSCPYSLSPFSWCFTVDGCTLIWTKLDGRRRAWT